MSYPLLPEVVPETDANPASFYDGMDGVWGSVTFGADKIWRMRQMYCFRLASNGFRGFAPWPPDQRLCSWIPMELLRRLSL